MSNLVLKCQCWKYETWLEYDNATTTILRPSGFCMGLPG